MNLSIGKKIALGFALAMLILLIIGATLHKDLKQVEDDSKWVTHTLQVEQELSNTMLDLVRAESSSRGYMLNPDSTFQDSARTARIEVQAHLRTLRTLMNDNANQMARLDHLDPLVAARVEALNRLMQLHAQNVATSDPQVLALLKEGRDTMEQIRTLVGQMATEEQHLLQERQERAASTSAQTFGTIVYGTLSAFIVVGLVGWMVTRSITNPLRVLGEGASKIGGGDYAHRVRITTKDETGELATLFNRMAEQVEERQRVLAEEDWVKSGLTKVTQIFQGQRQIAVVCQALLGELATLLDARHLVLYLARRGEGKARFLQFQAGYGCDNPRLQVQPGEGLVGQALVDKQRIVLREIPDDYVKINSVLGEAKPRQVVVQPALFEGEVKAVIELATLRPLTSVQLNFLGQFSESFGVVINMMEAATRTEELLQQAQVLSQDLQARQSELKEKNDRLEDHAARLKASEFQLQEQQEELKQTNEELEQANEEMQQTNEEMEEKVTLLAEQKKEMERINSEVEQARESLEEKAAQLAQTSKYKSEFLTSMSHELRTPLNSLLILSKMLADNEAGNLTPKQTQYASTIYSSGNDLLELINDILDLSKIEAGAVELEMVDSQLTDLREFFELNFRHVAETKGLAFHIEIDPHLPASIRTDTRRLQQVVKNLLSNAFKFTHHGAVDLLIAPATGGWRVPHERLDQASSVIAFTVRDTGIGVPVDKQQLIFEAFQQAEAGTTRKYGGTGLGLSISRELAWQLGGTLELVSEPDKGSSFTLYLPTSRAVEAGSATPSRRERRKTTPIPVAELMPVSAVADALAVPSEVEDDRGSLLAGDRVLLIIEDDRHFAGVMVDFAREKGFKAVVARSVAQGIAIARQIVPSAITLDLHLPDNDGWIVLDQLKHDPKTRHIPVHIISVDEERERSMRLGAVSYFQKPVTREVLQDALNRTNEFLNRPIKNLLILEDDATQRESMVELIGNGDVKTTAVGTAADAFRALETIHFDCLVLDLGLPDMPGIEFIRKLHDKYGATSPPVIVYTGKELSREEETELRRIAESIVIKNVRSPERLLDETALFLHRLQMRLPEAKRRMIEQVQKTDSVLAGRKVLVVDDDVRNIFAITSALESAQMVVTYAESGQESLDILERDPTIEVVLMDVMMPGMDGFETIRRIRQADRFRRLPIISVTAKAMPGDREKCLQSGASDYITKPVDMDKLKSLLRVWLYK